MINPEPKKRGPKPKYDHLRPNQDGAPSLTVRLEPEAHNWAKSRPEGTRIFLERIILADKVASLAEQPFLAGSGGIVDRTSPESQET
jgi:hypothetical protein